MATRQRKKAARKRGKRPGHARRLANMSNDGGYRTIDVPDGTELWKPKAGVYKVDIIPYIVGVGNPNADEGDEYFERTYYVYKNLGPNEKTMVAIGQTFGDQDPVLKEFNRLNKDGADWNNIKDMKGKARQVVLIYDHGEPEKGVQLFEASYKTLGEKLDNAIRNADEDEVHKLEFDDPEAGATLRLTFVDEKIGKNDWTKVDQIEFKPRRNGLADPDLLEHGIVLDEIIKHPTADELQAAMDGTPDDADEDAAPPKKKRTRRKAKPKDEEEDQPATAKECGVGKGDTVIYEGDECTITRVSPDGTSLTLKDSDGETIKAVAPDTVELVEEEEETPPPKKKRTTKKKPAKPEPDPEEEDEEEWEDDEADDEEEESDGEDEEEWEEDWDE